MWTVDNIGDLTGKTAIITGSNSGIGFETAKVLYNKGAHVILACRDLVKGEIAMRELRKKGAGILDVKHLDLSNLKSIALFTEKIKTRLSTLDMLINNAGVMTPPQSLSAEGYELQFGVNFLGHFALTGLLYSLLKKANGSRIVNVTSLAYTQGDIDFDNLKSTHSYDPFREYCQSKLANLIFTTELQRRMEAKGDLILSLASHPGITKTAIARHMTTEQFNKAKELYGEFMEPDQGALSTIFAATSSDVQSGKLYGPDEDGGLRGFPTDTPILENALNKHTGKRLWNWAEQVSGLYFP